MHLFERNIQTNINNKINKLYVSNEYKILCCILLFNRKMQFVVLVVVIRCAYSLSSCLNQYWRFVLCVWGWEYISLLHLFVYFVLTRFKNSSRVFGSSRNTPSIVDVTVLLLIFCTPRITMHICLKNTYRNSVSETKLKPKRKITARKEKQF